LVREEINYHRVDHRRPADERPIKASTGEGERVSKSPSGSVNSICILRSDPVQIDRHTGRQMHFPRDIIIYIQTDRQTYRQKGLHAGR